MTSPFTENEITRKLTEVLEYDFRVSPAEATHTQIYKALSKIVVNYLKEKRSMFMTDCNSKGRKQVYYLSMEFLMGRSLKTNLYNLGMQDEVAKALKKLDVKIEHIYEEEPDLQPAILTDWQPVHFPQQAILSFTNTVFSSRGSSTVGRRSFPMNGYPAAEHGSYPYPTRLSKFTLTVRSTRSGSRTTTA